jgi:hypothetical protein
MFAGSENIKITLNYNNNNGVPESKGVSDHIKLIAKSKLQGFGKQFHFFSTHPSSIGIISHSFSNATIYLKYMGCYRHHHHYKRENPQQALFSFVKPGELRKYVAILMSQIITPYEKASQN